MRSGAVSARLAVVRSERTDHIAPTSSTCPILGPICFRSSRTVRMMRTFVSVVFVRTFRPLRAAKESDQSIADLHLQTPRKCVPNAVVADRPYRSAQLFRPLQWPCEVCQSSFSAMSGSPLFTLLAE